MRYALSAAVGLLIAGCFPLVSRAAVTNGDFETGDMTGWTVTGSGSAKTSSIGVAPPEGTYQGYIETTGNFTATAPIVAVAMGLTGPTIADLRDGTPVNGTGIQQSVTVSAGDVLTYNWNFISDELNEAATFNDFAFFTISGAATLLASRNSSTWDMASSPPGFDGQTDWATGTYTFASSGTYDIGFVTFNVGDAGHNSALLLDSIAILVPEPATLALFPLAATTLLLRRRRRQG